MKKRYLIQFCYDGSNFNGYQCQKGLRTIQGEMEEALRKINNGQKTNLVSTGRTDKGVHALMQYGHCDLEVEITPYKLKRALNSNLADDIHVIKTKEVSSSFHARYFAKQKTYQYYLNMGEYNPLRRHYAYQHNYPLQVDKMKEAIHFLEGKHDFRAFVTDNKEKENCEREIYSATIENDPNHKDEIIFTFVGNGFMRYQVRNMVGLLLKVGLGKIEPCEVKTILESKTRLRHGCRAPSEGLYLKEVLLKEE